MMNSDMTMMNAPTEVIVNTFVRSIDKIDDYKMEWVFGHQIKSVWSFNNYKFLSYESHVDKHKII